MTSLNDENLLGYICEYHDVSLHSIVQIIHQNHIDDMIEVTLKVLAYEQQLSDPNRDIKCEFSVFWASDFSFRKPRLFSMRVLRAYDATEAIKIVNSKSHLGCRWITVPP